MAKWKLQQPPQVTQGTGYKCWAAALESWLAVTPGRPKWTQESLLQSSAMWRNDFNTRLPEGAIDANIFKDMATHWLLGLRMSWDEIPASQGLADSDLYERLREHGYLLLSYTVSSGALNDGGVRHCVVVWAADDAGNVAIMNPSTGSYQNKTVDDFGSPMLIAFRAPSLSPLG